MGPGARWWVRAGRVLAGRRTPRPYATFADLWRLDGEQPANSGRRCRTAYSEPMATPATEIEVGGTPVRVTSGDRVIFPATDSTPEATKLDIVQYYASVGPGILRALRMRPTTLERYQKGVHQGTKLPWPPDGQADAS